MKMKNKTYDTLKTVALIVAPILTFTSAVCAIWNVPYSEQITATLAALAALIGTLLKDSSDKYNTEKKINENKDTGEDQMLMMENMLEEDEQQMIKGE